jgi:iron complex outermembrane receptor protein
MEMFKAQVQVMDLCLLLLFIMNLLIMKKSLLLSKLLFLILIGLAFDAQADLPDSVKLKEVLIVEKLLLKKEQAGVKYQKIDSLVLSTLAHRSLSEVLSENTPIFIKTYGRGSMASASFRGTAPSHTKVLWNDIEINSPMLGMVDFSLIPTWFMDDVSLSYGAASVKKTGGALGGSVELSNRPQWNKGFSFHTLSSAGSYDTYDQFAAINYARSGFSSNTKAFYSCSANDFEFYNKDIISSVDLNTGEKTHPKQKQRNADYQKYGFLQELYYKAGDKDMISFKLWSQKSNRSLPLLSSDEKHDQQELDEGAKLNNFNRQNDETTRAVFNWKHYAAKFKYALNAGYIHTNMDYFLDVRLQDKEADRQIDSKSQVDSYFLKASMDGHLSTKTKISASLAYREHQVDTKELVKKTAYNEKRSEQNLMTSIEHEWAQGLTQSMMARLPMIKGELEPLIWASALQFQKGKKHMLNAQLNMSRNYRRPTLNDLYFQPGGNPDLRPEKGYTGEFDLGYAYIQPGFEFKLDASYYQSDIKDWILWLYTFKGYWEPVNVKRVKLNGVELKLNVSGEINPDFKYKLITNYAYTQSINHGETKDWADDSQGKQLPYIPEYSANVLGSISWKQSFMTYQFNYYSERFTTSSNTKETKRDYLYPYYMSHLSFGQRFKVNKKIRAELQVKVDNLLDETYRSILQRPMPGRNYTLLLDLKF